MSFSFCLHGVPDPSDRGCLKLVVSLARFELLLCSQLSGFAVSVRRAGLWLGRVCCRCTQAGCSGVPAQVARTLFDGNVGIFSRPLCVNGLAPCPMRRYAWGWLDVARTPERVQRSRLTAEPACSVQSTVRAGFSLTGDT